MTTQRALAIVVLIALSIPLATAATMVPFCRVKPPTDVSVAFYDTITLQGECRDDKGESFVWQVLGVTKAQLQPMSNATASFQNTTFSWVANRSGHLNVTLRARDEGGLYSQAVRYAVHVGPDLLPTCDPIAIVEGSTASGQTASLRATCHDDAPWLAIAWFLDGVEVQRNASVADDRAAPRVDTHTFVVPEGRHVVTLQAFDGNATGRASANQTFDVGTTPGVNAPPLAGFEPAANGLSVSVDASASRDSDGRIAAYAWTWGDGSAPDAGATASHAYAQPGTYAISLVVTDDQGAQATTTRNVTVAQPSTGSPQDPATTTGTAATFAWTSPAPLRVAVDAAGSGATAASYRWDWGDGAPAQTLATPTATHDYAAGGSYLVKLTVTDAAGATTTATRAVTVAPSAASTGSSGSVQPATLEPASTDGTAPQVEGSSSQGSSAWIPGPTLGEGILAVGLAAMVVALARRRS